jgi:2-haloalkanoic acid dehalogenase type II
VAYRWVTFDCYGTLIDWNGGVGEVLVRLFGEKRRDDLLARYHELEPQVQRENPAESYREVMATVLERLGADFADRDALGESLPSWQPFPEVRAALSEARERGWKLAILSNTDRDFIEASQRAIGVPFELAIVASEIGSYKPAEGHWHVFRERVEPAPVHHVHVAASLFHDVGPALRLGIPVVWINRLGEEPEPRPTRELQDLARLADTLDELVGA